MEPNFKFSEFFRFGDEKSGVAENRKISELGNGTPATLKLYSRCTRAAQTLISAHNHLPRFFPDIRTCFCSPYQGNLSIEK